MTIVSPSAAVEIDYDVIHKIPGSEGSKYEDECLLVCYAVWFQKLNDVSKVLTASIIWPLLVSFCRTI
jgi:hypothetical protein